jgi:hypothetical protein
MLDLTRNKDTLFNKVNDLNDTILAQYGITSFWPKPTHGPCLWAILLGFLMRESGKWGDSNQ